MRCSATVCVVVVGYRRTESLPLASAPCCDSCASGPSGNRRAIYDKYGSSTATGRSQQASGSTYSQNFYTARDRGYGTYRQRSRPQGSVCRAVVPLSQGPPPVGERSLQEASAGRFQNVRSRS